LMGRVVGVRSLAGVTSRICERCLQELPAEKFHLKNGRINSTLCKECTSADSRLRLANPSEHARVLEARWQARADASAKITATAESKVCSKCGRVKPLAEFRKHRGLYGRASWCRECERQHKASYQERNADAINAKKRHVWALTERTEAEKSAAAERSRVWYGANKERAFANYYRWVEENREAFNAIQQKRRAVKCGAEANLTSDEWLAILDCFDRCCAYCLSSNEPLTMDHVIALSRGGSHTADNVVPACRSCNSKKGARPIFTMVGKAR
jgi:5-methylcytosine-specific restriction endonuclease McrA